MVSVELQLQNPSGLHLRPAGILCKAATKFQSHITITTADGTEANAKSVLSVLSEPAVSPYSGVFHKYSKSRRIIADITPVVAKYTFMGGDNLSSFCEDIDCVGLDPNQYLLIGIFSSF